MTNIDAARRLMGAIAALDERGDLRADDEERAALQRAIEAIWHAQAVYLAARYGAVATEPGYVARGAMLVPVYLLEDIPSEAELAELAAVGLEVRVSADGTICLSGSVALLRTLEHVGDLDFCEYAEYRLPRGTQEIVASVDAHARRPTTPICRRVKVVPMIALSCDSGWDAARCALFEKHIDNGARHLKLDFVVRTGAVGVVEATNVVLLLDGVDAEPPGETTGTAHESTGTRAATLAKSYAGQEVAIASADAVLPRPIGDPDQLGRYINFLRRQVDAYRRDDPLKALKRGLSLTRVMLLDEHGEAIIDLLRDEHGALAGAMAAREALLRDLAAASCESPERRAVFDALGAELQELIARLRARDRDRAGSRRNGWRDDAQNVLTRLISDVTLLIARA